VADTQFTVDRGFFDARSRSQSLRTRRTRRSGTRSTAANLGLPGRQLYTVRSPSPTPPSSAHAPSRRPEAEDVDTATYLFLADVIYQAPTGAAPPYFRASWGRNRVNYGMDPETIAKYSLAEWREALTQIPTISIVTE